MFFSGKRPKNLGVSNGLLAKCPKAPNCVSSQDKSKNKQVAPLRFSSDTEQEMLRLKMVLENFAGVTVIESQPYYLYAECKSPLMGFVDDLEFYWSETEKLCHIRSGARLGYSDFGKNRQRVEEIRAKFQLAI